MNRFTLLAVAALTLGGAWAASADVLVMQDGRRIRGELVSVNRGLVLFDEIRERSASKRRMRINKDEVARIVLRESRQDDDDLEMEDDGPFGRRDDDPADRRDGRLGRDRDRDRRPDDSGTFGRDRDRDDDPLGRDEDLGTDDRREGRDTGLGRADSANTRLITVSARQPWTDTGIDVRTGDVVRFAAEGTIQWGAGRQDGPAGEYNSPVNTRRPVPGRPAGALIGRIGTAAADVFFIGGDRAAFRIRTSGRLYLGVNDDSFTDNSGSFEVRITR
jgi:hypothetical protein